ncbi:MAG: sigma-70 family RNA polymerase sigma factor [Treponema sp.]|uniref:sigma-70 family RNA polymerase sigma factor n=1 Tax=Treponema sp. TaxID=166 RepID=UPI0025DF314B|nr:sigma-70 family RNA polymerase sigma factor [Treponema sp.]MBQ9281998.1 sigma-70 family RNA polymerase sigma factor [Treponema sp.]
MVSILNYPNYKILSADEEFELAMCAKKGDKAARDLLILSNIAFAISYSKKFAGYHLEKDDLIQEAITGLVRAADKFIPETGNRFITYAKFWIRNEIQRAAHKASKTPASCLSDLSIDENSDAEEFISSICDNEIINVEDDYIDDETCICVKKAVASLGEKEADIIARHYGFDNVEPESLSEIAESYGLTKPRIHQIEQKAFYTLRNSLEDLYA